MQRELARLYPDKFQNTRTTRNELELALEKDKMLLYPFLTQVMIRIQYTAKLGGGLFSAQICL